MKNRIICLVILILSLVAFAASFNSTQAYYHNSRGNSFFKEKKFDEARDEYNKSLKIKESNEVRNNIIKSLYEEKKYKEITETPSTEYFIRGNSYAFLGDEAVQQNPEEAIKNYKAALEEYKLTMKTSSDINIKKNYEIVLKKIEDLNSQNQQNQDNQNDKQDQQNNQNQQNQDKQNDKQDQNKDQDNKQDQQNNQNQDKQDQNKDQDNKQDQQNNQNQQNQDKQNDKQDQNKDQDNKQDQQNNQNQQNQDKQNDKQDQNKDQNDKQNSIPQGEVQPIDSKDDVREGEVRAILKRLEGNEKQSFKNNERVINIDTGNSNNRW